MDDPFDDGRDGPPMAELPLVAGPPSASPWTERWAELPPSRVPQEAPRPRHWSIAVVAFVGALAGGLTMWAILAMSGALDEAVTEPAAPPVTVIERVVTELVPQEAPEDTAQAVATKVVPSIVTVSVGSLDQDTCVPFASGSGVVLDADGRIATNHHVVEGSDCQQVIFEDGVTYDALLLGSDALTDLAVLDIEATDLTPIELGSADGLEIGETTIAVGNPLGQVGGSSLTAGVLSAIDREVDFGDGEFLFGMLQTDAPITQGSSGGALVDGAGRLIGITSAIGVSEAGAEGIGYAIPVELVTRITDEIIATGGVDHAFLGIEGTDHIVARGDGGSMPAGAEVTSIENGSAAAQIELGVGDVIVGIGDQEVLTMTDLVIAIRMFHAGDEVTLRILEDGEAVTRTVVLGVRPLEPADG